MNKGDGANSGFPRNRLILGTAGAVAVAMLLIWLTGGGASPSLPVATAEQGHFVVTTTTVGELAAVNSKHIPAPPGWNNNVTSLIDEGTIVSPGDELARFDTDQLEKRVEERQAAYEGAMAELENQRVTNIKTLAEKKAALQRQELSLEKAKLQAEAMKFESKSRQRQQELDLRRSELDLQEAREDLAAQKDIAAAMLTEKEVKARKERLDLEESQENLLKMTVLAPDSGMVVHKKIWTQSGSRKIRVGDRVWNGLSIMELPDLSSFLVNTWVNEVDIHRLALDQPTEVTIDALQDRTLTGKVTRISPLARQEGDEDKDKIKVFDVDILLEGDVTSLLPGMTAQCRIIHQEFDDVTHVPLEAVFQEEDGPVVYRQGGKSQSVQLGPVGEDDVIIETGVDAGDVLLLVRPGDENGAGS
ncbi:MAG: HlyD family efflux transporter periplasmic adaptor subunit [Candidatus Krumholzibacteriota bacterium]